MELHGRVGAAGQCVKLAEKHSYFLGVLTC